MAGNADQLFQKAEKTAASAGGGFSFFGGKTTKYEEAVDLYQQSANAYRIARDGDYAGRAFEKAAAIQSEKLNENMDAAQSLSEASKMYRKTSPQDAARTLDKAITFFTQNGSFRRAATFEQTLGEIYEQDLSDITKAREAYEKAAGWFEDDNAVALANKLYLKIAELAALGNDYYKAIELFERVSKQSLDNNLMRWSVKEYLFKAGLCQLATGDMVAAKRAILEKYPEMDNSFPQQREHQFLNDLLESVENQDADKFSQSAFNFDQVSKLDKFKTELLLRVKKNVEQEAEDFS